MCTVTVVPAGSLAGHPAYRLACNRDESVRRPVSSPPGCHLIGGRAALMPMDGLAGGTWIAVNDAGLSMTLLNASGGARGGKRRSRGLIIPDLLGHDSAPEAARQVLETLDPELHLPFRLVITDGRTLVEVRSDGVRLARRAQPAGLRPKLFTSSGLGDAVVEGPRGRLFEAFFLRSGDRAALQDAFHRHAWPDRPHLSVRMTRPGAATVSYTVIEVDRTGVRMRHTPGPPGTAVTQVTATLVPAGSIRACAG